MKKIEKSKVFLMETLSIILYNKIITKLYYLGGNYAKKKK
ncbi:hypothetical protein HMPREF3206_00805 [Fusobacterium equinum]|uniref:Uncharacterized protein n=1 Tax=Fusobacterium equinum TaxID=134605 RepID=A0A133NFA2_9FUSO|nr:hypothetical protein HMPREF3206_00805 [Fusobacterium equinum]